MKAFRLLYLVLLFTAGACKKEELDALPKATQSGKNTFGCLVDGNAFLPKQGSAISISRREPLQAYIYQHRELVVAAMGGGYVDIILRNRLSPDTYPIGEIGSGTYGTYTVSGNTHYTDINHPGTITLTRLDTIAKIAAGTFEFTAVHYQSSKTVVISEGRFDVQLR
jgi:hypothetical protein